MVDILMTMSNTPILTIAIPVYERKEYFDEALQSVLAQTVPVKILVVDNASSHDYFEKAVVACDSSFVSYYRNDENIGMYGNWNRCVELCSTEFVALLGDDDVLETEYAELFYKALEENPAISFYHGAYDRFGEGFDEIQQPYKAPVGLHSGQHLLENAAVYGVNINTNAIIFRKSLHSAFKFEYLKWAYNQDWLFCYSAFASCMGYGQERVMIQVRVNPTGNALTVGARAYLSTGLIYERIAQSLKGYKSGYTALALLKGKWVLRNALINGHAQLINDMIADKENPFGLYLSKLLAEDALSKMILNAKNKSVQEMFVKVLRLSRKSHTIYRELVFKSLIGSIDNK